MRENSKDLAYGLIGTLKYKGILLFSTELRKVSETEDQSNGKARERGDLEGLVW